MSGRPEAIAAQKLHAVAENLLGSAQLRAYL